VIANAERVRDAVHATLDNGDALLVLGGDCTVCIGVIAGCVAAGLDPGLVYFDMHPDLNTPASVIDGALDWMGLAHLLAVDGCVDVLSRLGTRHPLLTPTNVTVIGYEASQATEWERGLIAGIDLRTVSADDVRADPHSAARAALDLLPERVGPLVIHFDVDVIDFVDAPLSQNTGRNIGVDLDDALSVLTVLADEPRAAVLTVAELNPTHAKADPESFARFVEGVANATARL
jgi:arginase